MASAHTCLWSYLLLGQGLQAFAAPVLCPHPPREAKSSRYLQQNLGPYRAPRPAHHCEGLMSP